MALSSAKFNALAIAMPMGPMHGFVAHGKGPLCDPRGLRAGVANSQSVRLGAEQEIGQIRAKYPTRAKTAIIALDQVAKLPQPSTAEAKNLAGWQTSTEINTPLQSLAHSDPECCAALVGCGLLPL
jgi:hypothetical protein